MAVLANRPAVTKISHPRLNGIDAVVAGKHIPGYTGYWFAWAALHPKTAIWESALGDWPSPAGGNKRSGVYGFSGAGSQFGENRLGVVGECIWIYDGTNKKQLANGYCFGNKPGEFRVPLCPGRYVVRGPGGNRPIEIKEGRWARVDS